MELIMNLHGIVGARDCTNYGVEVTKKITSELTKKGINIVSGLARGIDTVAHKTCIENNGKTIAVLGHGLDFIYPKENINLAQKIIEKGGVIITEYLPGTTIKKEHFPRRNRLISGLSDYIVVTEASEKSGSLITANHAIDQGKEVFVVPGSILSKQSQGANHLIKDGANILIDSSDIC